MSPNRPRPNKNNSQLKSTNRYGHKIGYRSQGCLGCDVIPFFRKSPVFCREKKGRSSTGKVSNPLFSSTPGNLKRFQKGNKFNISKPLQCHLCSDWFMGFESLKKKIRLFHLLFQLARLFRNNWRDVGLKKNLFTPLTNSQRR